MHFYIPSTVHACSAIIHLHFWSNFSAIEIPYGDKDQKGDYTLQLGDLVDFNIATDRRDKLQRATNIQLVAETFLVSGELREQGLICSVKDGFGFIRCMEREARMFFHFSEMMSPERHVQINDEVQFTVIQVRYPLPLALSSQRDDSFLVFKLVLAFKSVFSAALKMQELPYGEF